jgi:histone-lysine N-methyltransferase SETMAR
LIACDETWILYAEIPTKTESAQWVKRGEKRPTKLRPQLTREKLMSLPFISYNGNVYLYFVSENEIINAKSFCKILRRMKAKLNSKFPKDAKRLAIIIMDNARPHCNRLVDKTLKSLKITKIKHPPYSPDLSIFDFDLFDKLKKRLRKGVYKTR